MHDTVLLVDDEHHVLTSLTRILADELFEVVCAGSGEEALKLMETTPVKVVVSDERMVGMQGSELLTKIKELYPHTQRILLTGHASEEATMKAVNQGEIYRFFTKPWDEDELKSAIRSAIDKYNLEWW